MESAGETQAGFSSTYDKLGQKFFDATVGTKNKGTLNNQILPYLA